MNQSNQPRLSSENTRIQTNQTGIQFLYEPSNSIGQPIEVADGLWWIRLPISSTLEYVNAYVLRDGSGLTLIDTGVRSEASRTALNQALATSPLSNLPLRRVLLTHFHPDHIGLAGELALQGAQLWMSRTCWLTCKLLIQNASVCPQPSEVEFMRLAGLSGVELEAFKRRPANRYASQVAPLPDSFVPISEGLEIRVGERTWRVRTGNGHAAEHVSLWSDSIAIVGDQVLPSISSNLSVHHTEPDADLVSEWLYSCDQLAAAADDSMLGLSGHGRPFKGLLYRIRQIRTNVELAMHRLSQILARPSTAVECLEQFHNRTLPPDLRRQMLPEMVGFLNHLMHRGEADRQMGSQGAHIYSKNHGIAASNSINRPL